jgi:hypothetical protein
LIEEEKKRQELVKALNEYQNMMVMQLSQKARITQEEARKILT